MRSSSRKPSRATWSAPAVVVLAAAALLVPSWAAAQGAAAETHTVRDGDTLWDLARKYRGDPFLWPDIYRLNTAVVEDPHWIYPGEVLRLVGGENVAAVPATDTPAPPESESAPSDTTAADMADTADTTDTADTADTADTTETYDFAEDDAPVEGLPDASYASASESDEAPLFASPTRHVVRETLRAYTDQPPQPLHRSEFYSSGFLTEGERLPLGMLLGPVTPAQIRSISNRDIAALHTSVGLEPPDGATYQVGDSLLIVRFGREIQGYGRIVMPTGVVRVTAAADGRYVGLVVAVYGAMRKGQLVLPAEKFTSPGHIRPKAIADGLRAQLLGGNGRQDLKAPQMVVFINKGRQDGVAAGDLFEARRQPRRLPDGTLRVDDVMAELQVVHVRERSATARIVNVLSPDLPPGTEVRQVAKLP